MRSNGFAMAIAVLSLTAVTPASSMAAVQKPCTCTPAAPTAASYTWNFSREASQLLGGIQADAAKLQDHASTLNSFDMNPELSWESHADQLMSVRREVNDMGSKLCRLEVIRTAVQPWQRTAIDRVAPTVRLLADNAQDALVYVNANQGNFWTPVYRKYTQNLYAEASTLSHSVKSFEEYAKARREDTLLGKELGLRHSS